MAVRVIALFCWAFLVWVLLIGAGISVGVAVALAPLGRVAGPWRLLAPRRLAATVGLFALAARRIVLANLRLSWLIWHPRIPLRSGMVIVPTSQRSAGGLTAVGLITSLIVDNQLVDLDPSRAQLQYHAVEVPGGGPENAREAINGPVEDLLAAYRSGQDADEQSPAAR
jgi:multicomponent Na+:H+ antiporter subunit E